MKIAMFTQHAAAFADDVAITGLTRTLARQGHKVTVFTSKRRNDEPESTTADGVTTVRIPARGANDDPLAQVPAFTEPLHRRLRLHRTPPRRLPRLEDRFGVPAPLDSARDRQDAVLVGPDPTPAASRRPRR